MRARWPRVALACLVVVGTLAYLRDPGWLIHLESGFYGWERNRAGQWFRWMGPKASFFVPSDAQAVTIPLHALFITDDRSPFTILISVNDRLATKVTLPDEYWKSARVPIAPQSVGARLGRTAPVKPPWWSRRVMRIDLRANRTWSERAISVQVGELQLTR
jgi:hypothetical protein